ncbi:MAG: hypothetical protein E7578_06055 [Ruminococcaceae bacterium]|nr:hypothetical protein [Oscillospiraceae bacterium]
MKKILSSILTAATLASAMLVPVTAEDAKSVTQEVDVLYMTTQPTFDGVINADEWGATPSFTVSGADAAKPGDTAPSAQNTFAHYEFEYDTIAKEFTKIDEQNKALVESLTYDVWLRWDQKYLYIAAKVNDPDGYYLPAGRERIWDGDCVQFRIDPQGPNGYQKYKNPDYDYKTEGFNVAGAESIGRVPWAYKTKICNIGLGAVGGDTSNTRNVQAYDMADQGTGKMEKPQLLNDAKKLGPNVNPLKDEKDYASLFNMTITNNGDGTSTNCYECAVPWAFIDQWGFGQVAVGYAWGMSLVVLDGWHNTNAESMMYGTAYQSYLTWGSGICGAQQDVAVLNDTIGGSNAIILSDKDIEGNVVEGLPQVKDDIDDKDVVRQVISAEGMSAYYLSSGEHNAVDGDYELSLDVAYLGTDPINPDRTYIGTWLGEGYGMAAGWDAETKKFFVAEQLFNNGINKDIPYAESEEEFDWQIGDWHNLTIKVQDQTVTISLDGEVVLVDEDKRNTCLDTSGKYSIITYNIGDYVYDNYKITTGGEVVCDYTCDTDDEAFTTSDFQLMAIPMAHMFVEGKCKNADPESLYNCLMRKNVTADGKPCLKCDFCGTEEVASVIYGDVTGDEKVTLSDVSKVLQSIAKWDVKGFNADAADVTGDGKVTLSDASRMLQYIAKWNVTLGPKA